MKAIVTREFKGCAEGEHYPRVFKVGEEIEGALAVNMYHAGYAKKSLAEAPKNKALEAAPDNRFRSAGVEGGDGDAASKRAKPKRKPGRPRKKGTK